MEESPNLGLPAELQNLAADLDEEELNDIAAQVIRDFKQDEESRKEWLEKHAHWIDLFYQNDKPRNGPWEGSSEECIPVLAEACTQFHARAMSAFFPNGNIIKAIPTGNIEKKDLDRAERVGKHMSWQLLTKDKTYKPRKDALLMSVAVHGSFFTKTYYDPLKRRVCVENVRAEDLVVPYGMGPREIESIDRKTHIIYQSVNDTKILHSTGYFVQPAVPWKDSEAAETQQAIDRIEGNAAPGREDNYFAKILEQHRLLDLDGDGIAEPYVVTVDAQAQKVLRISVRYEVDDAGTPLNYKEPIEYFTHYPFMPNPDGFYGLGMGHLVGKINTAVNKLLRQTIDAGTLANMKGGFIDDAIGIKGGETEFSMGKFKKVKAVGGRIADHIMELQFSGPDQTIIGIMELLTVRGDRLATVTEAMTGQTNTVQQPTTILALIDQALQVFSAVQDRLIAAWNSELRKIYRLNSKYLDDKEYITVQDVDGLQRFQISRQDYADDMEVAPIADPKMATEQQKLARAEAEWAFLSQNPLVMSSPGHFYAASARYLKAIGSMNLDEVLPRPMTDPMRVDDPKMENIGALMPKPLIPPVYPDQDHLAHLMEHEQFLMDPAYGGRVKPEGKALLDQHMQNHLAYLYGATETDMLGVLNGPVGGGVMETAPRDGMALAGLAGTLPPQMGPGPDMGGGQPTEGAAGGSGPPVQSGG